MDQQDAQILRRMIEEVTLLDLEIPNQLEEPQVCPEQEWPPIGTPTVTVAQLDIHGTTSSLQPSLSHWNVSSPPRILDDLDTSSGGSEYSFSSQQDWDMTPEIIALLTNDYHPLPSTQEVDYWDASSLPSPSTLYSTQQGSQFQLPATGFTQYPPSLVNGPSLGYFETLNLPLLQPALSDQATVHTTSDHIGDRLYNCGLCHKTYSDPKGVVRHVRREHKKERLACPVCDKLYSPRGDNLRRHVRQTHLIELDPLPRGPKKGSHRSKVR